MKLKIDRLSDLLNRNALFLLALIVLPMPFAAYYLQEDFSVFLIWWLALSVIGWAFWPLAARLFPGGDRGYLLAKPLGLLLIALTQWTGAYWRVLPFGQPAIIGLVILGAAVCWLPVSGRQQLSGLSHRGTQVLGIVGGEWLFTVALIIWTFARGLKPELDSLEKFMNVGMINSLWRTDWLPAADMWYSGASINYYYFGHFTFALLARLTRIRPEVAYNLGLATTFAMTFGLSFSIGSRLYSRFAGTPARKADASPPRISATGSPSTVPPAIALLARQERGDRLRFVLARFLTGILSAFLVAVFGNAQSFFYREGAPGRAVINWLIEHRFASGELPENYWFADATRFIGYNPDIADKTIHEFPWYSFLVADLHAHVNNLMFVLLLIALMIGWSDRSRALAGADGAPRQPLAQALRRRLPGLERFPAILTSWLEHADLLPLALSSALLAVFMMGNYWDFAIYLVLLGGVLLLHHLRGQAAERFSPFSLLVLLQAALLLVPFLLVNNPLAALFLYAAALLLSALIAILRRNAWTRTGAQLTAVFFVAHLIALPFNLRFDPITKSIKATVMQTPLWQLLILWLPHILVGLLFSIIVLAGALRVWRSARRLSHQPVWKKSGWLAGFVQTLNPADALVVLFVFAGISLIIVPELVYVVDIYEGDFKRANTMFKFTYQAFVLLALAWGYIAVRIWSWQPRRVLNRTVAIIVALALIMPAWYSFPAARQWLGEFSRQNYKGLDGLAPLALKDSPQIPGEHPGELLGDVAVIRWLNANVDGQPVILEAYGSSYTDFCRISAFTGLPTVLGWDAHEWLWRTSKTYPKAFEALVAPREGDIHTLYTTTDAKLRDDLIRKYRIEYIVVGALERFQFSDDPSSEDSVSNVQELMLIELGDIVFESSDTYVIKLAPTGDR